MDAVIAVAATVICVIACALLVVGEWRHLAALRIAAKVTASAAFIVVAADVTAGHPFAVWMIVGLVFGAIGDVFLLGRGKQMFLAGLVAFLIGHLAYVVGMMHLVDPASWLAKGGFYAAIPIVVGVAALIRLWPKLGSLRIPVIIYVAAIVLMVVGAIAAGRASTLPAPQRAWLVVGAALFFVSDLAVARDRFVARELSNRLWGLPAYYAGQLLIAWSIS